MTRINKDYTEEKRKRNTSKCSSDFAFIFATRLKTAREYAELSQDAIAEKLGIDCRTYQKYESLSENNNVVPNLEKVVELSLILNCDITYLTGENNENEFRRNTAAASKITGLNYKTIEVLETIKNSNEADNKNHIHKCILFVLDFLLQRVSGRWIFWNMFQYLFKEYSFVREDDGGGTNTIELEADPIIPERNVSLFVNDISEGIFFSNITNGITKIKVKEGTINFDTSRCDYLPTKEKIINDIHKIEKDISTLKEKEYKKYLPYTPEYANSFADSIS